jgi:hypothetical protein
MRKLKGSTVAVVVCLLGIWLTSVGVLAGKPDKQPLPQPGDFLVHCGPGIGDIVAHTVTSAFSKTFTAPDGSQRILINGSGRTTFTRLSDGKSVQVNSSGPAFITVDANGVTVIGRGQSTVLTPTSARQYTGQIHVNPDTGEVLSSTGHVTDICQMFAP